MLGRFWVRLRRRLPIASGPADAGTAVVWYAAPRVWGRGVALLLLPVYTRVLDPTEMGTAMVALAFGGVASLVIAPGVEGVYLRWAYRARVGDREPAGARGLGTLAIVHLALLTFGVGVLVLWRDVVGRLVLPGIPVWPFYDAIVATVALGSLAAPIRAEWRAAHRPDKIAALELVQPLGSASVVLIALLVLGLGPVSVLLGDLVMAAALVPASARRLLLRLREGWESASARVVLPIAIAGLPLSVSTWALSGLDRLLLNWFAGPGEAGLYAVGYQVGAAVAAAAIVLNKEWQPLIFGFASEAGSRPPTLQRLWIDSSCVFLLLGGSVALFSEDIVRLILGERYLGSAAIVPLVVIIGVLKVPHFFLVNMALATGQARALVLDSVASVGTLCLVALVMIPELGARGAAWAGILAYVAGLAVLGSRRWNQLRLERPLLAAAAAFGGAVILGSSMPGTLVTRLAGAVLAVLLARRSLMYWQFLKGIRPVEIRS